MGSSGAGAADCGIGPIVWVRRRNGSWWPGKILEADELAECNLTSPRTGTPVKLLGREDASVDWYNLEKSKRVKAFRCGEFDDCIERAESTQGMPIKKREKYARREDAILHALELEKELLRKQGKLDVASDTPRSKTSGFVKKDLATGSEDFGNNSGKLSNANSNQVSKGLDVSIKDGIAGSPMQSLKATDGSHVIFEDDHSEETPRMRGLQDFGLRTTPFKRKLSSVDSDGLRIPVEDNHTHATLGDNPSLEETNHANGVEQPGAPCQAKRNRCFYSAKSSDPLNDKELPPSHNKMYPSQFEDDECHHHPTSLNEENSSSGFMEGVSDSSETDSSDSSETEPDMDREIGAYPDAAVRIRAEEDHLGELEAPGEHGSTSSNEADEALSGEMSHLYPDDPLLANEAVSKWRLKGKRNSRHLTKRSVDRNDRRGFNRPAHGTSHGIKGRRFDQRAYGVDDADLDRKYMGTPIVGLDNGNYLYPSRFASKGRNNVGHSMIDWEEMTWEDQPAYIEQWDGFNPVSVGRHHFGGRTRSMLIDVDLKVQASYQKEPVPLVSLISKLNGKAIIGHPIQIQALEDGSSEPLVSTNDYCSNDTVDHVPAWKTARRTNLRVPRPHLSSVLVGDAAADDFRSLDQERKPPFKKSGVGSFSHRGSPVTKSLPHNSRPLMDRKLPRRLPKKVSSSSNQKTRTLSSIAIQHNFGTKAIHDTSGCQMDGLIKAETSGPTTVACIPVKLVFSRLLEKINRPPSKAVSKAVLNRDAERQS